MGRSKKPREQLLAQDLRAYRPKRWRINMPLLDYTLRMEDLAPALSGAIGKVSLVAAFAMAWAAGLGITDPAFVVENVRLELVLAGMLTLLFCAVLNPYAGPPGTLAPLVPVVTAMAASGVHPLPLGILVGAAGLALAGFGLFGKVMDINGPGTKGGIILLFGFLGAGGSAGSLRDWAGQSAVPDVFALLMALGLAVYILLTKWRAKWLIIPACAGLALAVAALFGLFPAMQTGSGLPIINPSRWWNGIWGIGWGLNTANFMKCIPYALLVLVMWPIDALAIQSMQESNYPPDAKNAVFDVKSTYAVVSARNILGAVLGGSQIAAVWRSFMIPLATVKRPIAGGALLLGLLSICFGLLGFPIDIAVFPPLLWLVLIFGVYVPLLEAGFAYIKSASSAIIATVCLIGGISINPVIGWVFAVMVENFGLLRGPEDKRALSKTDKLITVFLAAVIVATFLMAH